MLHYYIHMYFVISVFTTGLQNDHKSIMKLIEEKIHQLHEEARNKQNVQTNKGEQGFNGDNVNTCNTHVCNGGKTAKILCVYNQTESKVCECVTEICTVVTLKI